MRWPHIIADTLAYAWLAISVLGFGLGMIRGADVLQGRDDAGAPEGAWPSPYSGEV